MRREKHRAQGMWAKGDRKKHVQWKQRCNKDEERAIVIIGEHRGCVERLITANTDAMN